MVGTLAQLTYATEDPLTTNWPRRSGSAAQSQDVMTVVASAADQRTRCYRCAAPRAFSRRAMDEAEGSPSVCVREASREQ
jgi:hypothetical protein